MGFNPPMTNDPSGWTQSAQAWINRIDTFDLARQVLLDKPMIRLCGRLKGSSVLDIGCGEGRFCRMLSERGAKPIGLDPTPALLDTAKSRDPKGTYVLGSGEDLPFENASFDVAVFYLTLIDIPDFRKAIAEAARILEPGGRLVMGNIASHATSPTGWLKDLEGKKLYYPIDHYSEERSMTVEWAGIKVINFHRPLSAYMEAFLSSGLLLREYLEPIPTPEDVEADPDLDYERRVPYLVAMLWEKPA
jgi:SAM-dependent methyltransferase